MLAGKPWETPEEKTSRALGKRQLNDSTHDFCWGELNTHDVKFRSTDVDRVGVRRSTGPNLRGPKEQ